ncbi:unnamed protein product [Pleuronectes platessa]|uniref:Uncharacterized protein n=1 Tax=Pleuronectes platessa TaxID=8262 RepID=A0A9N7VVP7_PLEPL|nr:unnamed protein product [Pleuronectes platessa]
MESGYESSERNSSSPVSLDLNLGDRVCCEEASVSSSSSAPSWRNIRSKSSGALLQDVSSSSRGSLGMTAPPVGRSELDELQEEVLRRAKDESSSDGRRRRERLRSASTPRPSKYLDLDQLQIQGKGDSFERCVSEAELLLDQSLRLEQAGEVAAALSAVNEAVSKLRPVASEGGASSNSRLQRCMRRARSLQQRMQLQQRPQDSEAVRQHPEQQQQQQEEEQQLQEQPSEKALSLQILLTNRQGDQSAAGQDQEALPLSPCFVKPLPPKTISDPAYSAVAPREDNRTRGPCSRVGKPLSNAASLPALCVDTWEQSPLENLAPPPPPEEVEFPTQWTKASPVPIPAHALTPHSRTPSPIGTNDDCHLIMEKEPCYIRQGQTTPPLSVSPSRVAPTPPTRNWPCLHLEPHDDVVDSSHPPTYATADSPSSAPLPPVNQPDQTTSTAPAQGHRSLLPVERWAENVNRYFSFKNGAAAGGGGGGGGGEEEAPTSPCEELSELDSLYQASLLAPSMQRGSRGVSPQPTGNKPGVRRMLSGSGRSKTPTAEIERYAYRTPVTTLHKPASGDDESYSADNLRRIARSLSGTAIGSRPQNIPASRSCDPSVSRPPLTPVDLHSSTLPRRPSTSSLHLPSSSFTDPSFHHLQPRHHGPSAPAPPPHHPPSQTSRPHSSGPSTWGRTGVGPSVQQQFLVVSDRHQAPSEQSLHSIALNYGTLPRAPRRAPPPFSSLPRPGAGCTAAPPPAPQSLYATLSRPRRSANTTTGTNGHYRQPSLPIKVNGSAHYPPHHIPQPHHHPQHHLRVPGEAPSQPLRLDVPLRVIGAVMPTTGRSSPAPLGIPSPLATTTCPSSGRSPTSFPRTGPAGTPCCAPSASSFQLSRHVPTAPHAALTWLGSARGADQA